MGKPGLVGNRSWNAIMNDFSEEHTFSSIRTQCQRSHTIDMVIELIAFALFCTCTSISRV
jgi:hypothetical protein